MKRLALMLIHWHQFTINYSLYWYLRNKYQMGGGNCLNLILLRRMESKRCSSTGLGPKGDCTYIASPLVLPHCMNCIIFGRNAKIGRNVTVMQGVTIAEGDKNKMTIIEDDVMLGAGCIIMNNAHIGKGAKIGANAVVLSDVPAFATAVGVPARIIMNE